MSQSKSLPHPAPQWWIAKDNKTEGPFNEAYIFVSLQGGVISAETLACRVGGTEWKPLCQWPQFSHDLSATAEAASPPLCPPQQPIVRSPPSHRDQRTFSRPWNPLVIVWLSLIFSPVWCSIMAAVNARRLGLKQPAWRPISIGIGSLLLDIVLQIAIADSIVMDLAIYLLALVALWQYDLAEQHKAYELRSSLSDGGKWLVPVLAGLPAAMFVFLNFALGPFLPSENPPSATTAAPSKSSFGSSTDSFQGRRFGEPLSSPKPEPARTEDSSWSAAAIRAAVYWVLHGGGGKGLFLLLAALGAGIAAYWRKLAGTTHEKG